MIKPIKTSSATTRLKFDETFKREAVANWLSSGKSAPVIGEEPGISPDRLYAWGKPFGPNMFYTVTLPCTLWFLDKGKVGTDRRAVRTSQRDVPTNERSDTVLFIDARHIYRQVDRAHASVRTAARTRELRLPRLLSGQVDLS